MRRAAVTAISAALAAASTLLLGPAHAATAVRPNVLVILTDDQRFEGSGGGEGFLAVMPKLSKWMKTGGVFFPNAFATSSLCSPSRSSLMTGRYAHNTGVLQNGDTSPQTVFDQSTTLQHRLRADGYFTALSGKYLNTWPIGVPVPDFDHYAHTKGNYVNQQFNVDGTTAVRNGYTVTVTGNYALQFLQGFHSQDAAKPWYMEVATEAPHSPYTPDTKYQTAKLPAWNGNPATAETDRSDKPPIVQAQHGTLAQGKTRRLGQLRSLKSVDDMVGRLFTYLQSSGQLQNTIVVFASDNGMMWGEHGLLDKRYPYEQSVKVPLFIRWPGHYTPNTTSTRLVALEDVAPTILNDTGTAVPAQMIDGHDLFGSYVRSRLHLEYFRSNDAPNIPGWSGTWTPTSEYVDWYDNTTHAINFREAYNLTADPFQLSNLFKDANPANDPDIASNDAQVAADQACAGSACP